jgi:monoamine oxidase
MSTLAFATRAAAQTSGIDADVIVVGAGVAGLNTAWLVEQQGFKVLLLEARSRVGGRIFTLFDEPGYPEMGFNSMGSGYGRGIDAAARAGVPLVDISKRQQSGASQELVLGGRPIARSAWPTHPANPFPAKLKAMLPWEVVPRLVAQHNGLKDWSSWYGPANRPLDVSMHDFLAGLGLDDAAIRLAMDVAPYHGTNAYDVSALQYQYSDGWTKGQIAAGPGSFAVKGGNMHLPIAMAKLLKGDLLLNKEIVSVSSGADLARVACRDGTGYSARRVVMALPFSILRQIRIEPGLAGDQARAVHTLLSQPISVMFLRVSSPFWSEDGRDPAMWTDGPAGWVTAQRFGRSDGEVTGLMAQARGQLSHFWDRLGPQAAKQLVVQEIERLRPAARGKLKATHLQSWSMERFSGGGWGVHGPGGAGLVAAMAQPAGRVHFAGEHTAPANRGLEAALESSERVSIEVMDQL